MHNQRTRYFIYVRKSTGGEERQARSIGDQLAEIREIVRREKLEIVGSFEETQSAMSKGRPHFNDKLDRIEAGDADGIIAWHPDRLARNAFDGGRVIDLIDQGKIRDLRFCSFWFEPTAQGKLMLNLAFGQSKYYSDSLSVNIRRGQRQKVLEGVWSWKAPVGYLNDPKSRTIVPDPNKAPLIQHAFELYASGKYTLINLRETMNAAGLRNDRGKLMCLSRYQYFLKNPFYYGVFNLNGEAHEGAHEPLISKSLFDKAQEVMHRRSKPNTVRLKSYVYRGLFRCGECGSVITMETQKGHNYLRCTKRIKTDCTQRYLREEAASEQIATAIQLVSLTDNVADWMLSELEKDRAIDNKAGSGVQQAVQFEIKRIDSKLDRLTAAYLDAGAFTAAEFRRRKQELIDVKCVQVEKLDAIGKAEILRFEPLKQFVNEARQAKYVAAAGKPVELRTQLEKIGSNLVLKDKTLHWEPRGAWQLVVGQGSFAQRNTAPKIFGAVSAGESRPVPGKWSDGESNPDLLNAIQPSSR